MYKKKVFIVSDASGHDMSPAEKNGDLVVLSKGSVDKYNTSYMVRIFTPILDESKAEDFILVSGPTVMNTVACGIFAAKHGRLNLLLWRVEDGGEDRYVHRRIVFREGS